MRRSYRGDDGLTLVELVICVALTGVIATAVTAAIVVALRTSPAVSDRSDAAVNIQGLVTWLPQDVDSAAPDTFVDTPTSSGCIGGDAGHNLLRISWSEVLTTTKNYTASYRYVSESVPANGGRIVRVYCVDGGAAKITKMSGLIPAWDDGAKPVKVTLEDSSDQDSRIDTVRFVVQPVAGKTITIIGTTKNLNETLSPPSVPAPPTPPTQPANQLPTASSATYTVISGVTASFKVSGSDPENGALTATFAAPPLGWSITSTSSALNFSVVAPATADGTSVAIPFTLTDPAGGTATASVTFTVLPAGVNQPPSANASVLTTRAGSAIAVQLNVSDPEGSAMTATISAVPANWTATISGLTVSVTSPADALVGTYEMIYIVRDVNGATASATITVKITGPPPCVIQPPAVSPSTVALKKNNPDSLDKEVTVTIRIVSGYCAGLALHYVTGAPMGQYVRNFGTSTTTSAPPGAILTVSLPHHPSPELWTTGLKTLDVKDSSNSVIGTVKLGVTP